MNIILKGLNYKHLAQKHIIPFQKQNVHIPLSRCDKSSGRGPRLALCVNSCERVGTVPGMLNGAPREVAVLPSFESSNHECRRCLIRVK